MIRAIIPIHLNGGKRLLSFAPIRVPGILLNQAKALSFISFFRKLKISGV